jgi:AcrR family transcriptional regulator
MVKRSPPERGKKRAAARSEPAKAPRERILDAAKELFAGEKGFGGTTLNDILKEAKVPYTALYKSFPGTDQTPSDPKSRILLGLVDAGFGELNMLLGRMIDNPIEPRGVEKKLHAILGEAIRFLRQNERLAKILLLQCPRDIMFRSPEYTIFRKQLESVIQKGQAEGLFRAGVITAGLIRDVLYGCAEYVLSVFTAEQQGQYGVQSGYKQGDPLDEGIMAYFVDENLWLEGLRQPQPVPNAPQGSSA